MANSKVPRAKPGARVVVTCPACGKERTVKPSTFRYREVTGFCLSCFNASTKVSHGQAKTAVYRAWGHILNRCMNPKNQAYPRYGARGITVCERWFSFENFFADMGPKPSPQHSIDRIDNDGPYSPENCRWATWIEQQNNRRGTRPLTFNGATHTVADWVRITGLSRRCIDERLKRGWSVERTLSQPSQRG
jgi:hypothetical protein